MKKAAKIILIAVGALLALLLLAFALINTPLNKRIVKKFASEYIDGSLDYDRLRIHLIPCLKVRIDSLSLVSDSDTLASFSRLRASARILPMLHSRFDVPEFVTKDLYLHYRKAGDGKDNWHIFKASDREKDTTSVGSYPEVSLGRLSLGSSRALLELDGTGAFDIPFDLGLAVEAGPAKDGDGMDLSVGGFAFRIDSTAMDLNVLADVENLLGEDPHYAVDARMNLAMDELKKLIPRSFGVASAAGHIGVGLKADALQSELNTYKFHKAKIEGSLDGDRLSFSLPADSLKFKSWKPALSVKSGPEGLGVTAGFDSVYVEMGSILARVRDMENTASVTKVQSHGEMVPRLAVSTDVRRLFVQMGSGRIRTRDVDIDLSAQKHVTVARDSSKRRGPARPKPDFLEDESLEAGDVTFSLDSTLTNYLKEWDLEGKLTLARAGFVSPKMPLRTRISNTDINFTGNEFRIDSLYLTSGTSDLSLNGSVSGLRRALSRRGVLRTELNVSSKKLNVNEIVAALNKGEDLEGVVEVAEEGDESFVVDSISTERTDTLKTGLIIVPGNLVASVRLNADEIDVKDLVIDSLSARIKMQERTVQLTQTNLSSNYGKMKLDAYYSTRSKKDIHAGLDLGISEVSASQIIGLLPTVDSLMPALKSFHGILGCQVSATSQLDTNMNVIMPTLDGLIKISGEDLFIRDAGDLKRLTRLLLFKDKNIGHIDNLYASAVVHDNKLEVFPFELGVDRYRLALYGMQGFDNTMYYHISILKSPFLIRFGINIFGTTDNWRFRLCFPKYRPGRVPAFSDELDNVHVNITKSIRNIFRDGVEGVRRYNRQSMRNLDRSKDEKGFDPGSDGGEMPLAEQGEVMDVVIDNDFAEADKALEAEVEAILQKSYKDTEKIMKEYASQAYEKGISNQIEKLKAQSDKKKALNKKKAK